MADGISFDFSALNKLAADLERAAEGIEPFLKSALNVTSLKIKRSAQSKVRGRKRFGQAAQAITFDVTARKRYIDSEIGYDKRRGGAANLGNLVEFGAPGSPNALAPGSELVSSLHEEEADFVRGVERAVDDSLKKAGL